MSVIKTKEDKIIPGEFFIHFVGVVYNTGGIERFQVIQEGYEEIVIKVVVNDQQDFSVQRKKVDDVIKLEMGDEVSINWEIVDDIPTQSNGKYLYVKSNV
jgi:phenylacetate-CoA ligase